MHENWKRLVGKSTKDSGQMHEEWWVDTRKGTGGQKHENQGSVGDNTNA